MRSAATRWAPGAKSSRATRCSTSTRPPATCSWVVSTTWKSGATSPPPDARQFDERVAVGGDFAAEVANEDFAERDDILRLRVEQPDRLDVLLQPILAKLDHLLRRLHLLKQPPRRLVHPDVGRLRRAHDRDEQLKLGRAPCRASGCPYG